MSARDDLARIVCQGIKALEAGNSTSNCGGGCKDIADAVLTAGWVHGGSISVMQERVLAERDALAATVERVRALHARRPHRLGDFVHFGQTEFPDQCDHCRRVWPCDTAAALDPSP